MKNKYYLIIGIILVILLLILPFVIPIPPFPQENSCMYSETSKGRACYDLVKMGCEETSTKDIIMECFDANKDGKKDSSDTLQALCETYYGVPVGDQSKCRMICGCPK
ncbi:MAG: hypothetical protein GTN36_05675 [Candidatus Aenigmarchaeota archaeon]|nr:hypothetical protein [Candidatus Aenigmarchaeota archaeon]